MDQPDPSHLLSLISQIHCRTRTHLHLQGGHWGSPGCTAREPVCRWVWEAAPCAWLGKPAPVHGHPASPTASWVLAAAGKAQTREPKPCQLTDLRVQKQLIQAEQDNTMEVVWELAEPVSAKTQSSSPLERMPGGLLEGHQ